MQRGQATCVTSTLSVGTHSITATYNGTAYFAPSTSAPLHQVILARSAATTVTLTSSANPSLFGQPVTFTATVTAASGPVTGTVTFYTDDPWASRPTICYASTVSANQATCRVSTLDTGPTGITARYSGDSTHAQSPISNTVIQVVNP